MHCIEIEDFLIQLSLQMISKLMNIATEKHEVLNMAAVVRQIAGRCK